MPHTRDLDGPDRDPGRDTDWQPDRHPDRHTVRHTGRAPRRLRVLAAGHGLLLLLTLAGVAPASGRAAVGTSSEASPPTVSATALPAGFSDAIVAQAAAPTALAFTPDGRMLVTEQAGRVLVVHPDGTRTVALNLRRRVCDQMERGLVGIAVDPAFARNRSIYLYYTHEVRGSCGGNGPDPANRVSRFVLGGNDRIDPAGERVLLDHIRSPQAHHIAGDLEFGANGLLYVTVGDGVCSMRRPSQCGPVNDNSQLRDVPHGKVLRVTRSGRPAPGNPYADAPGGRRCTRPSGVPAGAGPCREIFASGFRNPFRFARRPGTNTFFVNDVGLDTWEEVNRLRPGRNYGWNAREGRCRRASTTECRPVARFTDPIHDYRHGECRSITGGAFVPRRAWPGMGGSYLYSDFACGTIFRLAPRPSGGFARTTFLTGARGPTHLRFGPHGRGTALYYLSYFTGTVHRIAQTAENSPPVAAFGYVPDGRTVSFSGAASRDPDGDAISSWRWDFGDGTSAVTASPRVTHTYPAAGRYQARLVVTDSAGTSSAPSSRTVHSGEHPPALTTSPAAPAEGYAVGQRVTLRAAAVDPEDGELAASRVTWRIRLRHANHAHPFLGPVTGGSVSFDYPSPENLRAAASSRLVALVSATDSTGHTTRIRRVLQPRTVTLRFRTLPAGGRLLLQGEPRRTPATVTSWTGYVFGIRAPDQTIDGVPLRFARWSDGGRRRHSIRTPAGPAAYVATYVR